MATRLRGYVATELRCYVDTKLRGYLLWLMDIRTKDIHVQLRSRVATDSKICFEVAGYSAVKLTEEGVSHVSRERGKKPNIINHFIDPSLLWFTNKVDFCFFSFVGSQ